jgi:hypothetical protein
MVGQVERDLNHCSKSRQQTPAEPGVATWAKLSPEAEVWRTVQKAAGLKKPADPTILKFHAWTNSLMSGATCHYKSGPFLEWFKRQRDFRAGIQFPEESPKPWFRQ